MSSYKVEIDNEIVEKIHSNYSKQNVQPNYRNCIIELLRNCYDGDADVAKINFQNFGEDYEVKKESKIIIEDNGRGVDFDILKNWFIFGKSTKPKWTQENHRTYSTLKGRRLIGGFGEGRMCVLFLGKSGKIITKTETDKNLYTMSYDFSGNHYKATITSEPSIREQGTSIEMNNLNIDCSNLEIIKLCSKLAKLHRSFLIKDGSPFKVSIFKNEKFIDSFFYCYRNKYIIELVILFVRLKTAFARIKLAIKKYFY